MAKRFSGDATHTLPMGYVEPYRLWFEFLKLAPKDSDIKVDKRIYAPWGDVENIEFSEWWSKHWRDLFAVRNSIAVVRSTEQLKKIEPGNDTLLIEVPLGAPLDRVLREIKDVLKDNRSGVRAQRQRVENAAFYIRRPNLKPAALRLLLRLYRLWLDNGRDVRLAGYKYFQWQEKQAGRIQKQYERVDAARKNIRSQLREQAKLEDILKELGLPKNWEGRLEKTVKRRVPNQAFIRDALEQYGVPQLTGGKDGGGAFGMTKLHRYIRKARRIAANVAAGDFPGKFGN